MTLSFKELADSFNALQEKHKHEVKTLERKHKLEKDNLLAKQHEELQEIKLSSIFHVGDVIALGKVDYLPTSHYIETFNIVAVGSDYLVGFDPKTCDNELLSWGDLLSSEKLYHNGNEVLL